MKNWVKGAVLGAALIGLSSIGAQAQVALTGTSGTITYNFDNWDGLSTTPANGWTISNATMKGQDAGSSNAGGFHALGNPGEVSLGFLATSSAPNITGNASLSFVNNTGNIITSITLSWDAETWRTAGRASTLSFSDSLGGDFSNYLYSAPTSSGVAGLQDSKTFTLTLNDLSIAAGDQISFSWGWARGDGSGSGGAIGLDNVNFSYLTDALTIPEPSTYALLGAGAGILIVMQLRRRKSEQDS